MSTYGTMRTRILDEFVNESITAAQINNAIQTAIKHYQREAWWFNQKVGSFSTVAAQELYSSSDYADIPYMLRIDSLQVGASTSRKKLRSVNYQDIEDAQDGSVTGEPEMYTIYDQKIRLYPIPSAVYTMRASYIYRLTTLSDDADTNAWVDECEELTRQAAKRILCTDILHDDAMAERYASLERVAYDRLRKENRERSPQKELRVDWPFNRSIVDVSRAI